MARYYYNISEDQIKEFPKIFVGYAPYSIHTIYKTNQQQEVIIIEVPKPARYSLFT